MMTENIIFVLICSLTSISALMSARGTQWTTGILCKKYAHGPYAALELSKNSWLLAIQLPDRDYPSLHLITGGDAEGLIAKLDSDDAQVVLPADGGLDPTRRIIDKSLS